MSTSTKKKMKTKFFLILTVAVAFSSKRDHSDESSYGLYKLTEKKSWLNFWGGKNGQVGSKGKFQMAWLEAMYESDPDRVDSDTFAKRGENDPK